MTETFTDAEIGTLRRGAIGAGLLVSLGDRGFFDSLREGDALAKHLREACGAPESSIVRRVAEGHGTGLRVTTSLGEVESSTLNALRASVQLLQSKAPAELETYRAFVLDVVHSVAAAAPGGDEAEGAATSKIEAALSEGREPSATRL
jgi:hypothetical protein